ncbi:MAG: SDR family oxidoreductase [Gammaproteobacteria bacterium]|nr:SDR family oxidoreductase [Gammaproteobacteria bacterium]
MNGKKILITGNMGYVGPGVISHLRTQYANATLVGVDLGYFGHCLTGPACLPEARLDVQYIMDVRTMPIDVLKGVDAVVHLAAISNDPMGNAYEEITHEINYEASVRVAKLAREAGVKSFVFASSCSVYGYAEGPARDENSELNPLTAYAKSKINTEKAIKSLASDDFAVTCLRFPTACGMSDRLRLDLVLNDFVAAAVATRRISILSDGTPWRPLIDVKDMARAIDWAICRDANKTHAFLAINAGRTEWNYQIKDLAEAVHAIMPGIEVSLNKDAQPDKRSYRVNFDMYKKLAPDNQPQVDLRRSIIELKKGLERIEFKDSDFRNSDRMRLKVLSGLREANLLSDRLEWRSKQSDSYKN